MRSLTVETPAPGLPPELDGLRVAHLSDLHVGVPGLNARALRVGVDLVLRERPDLVCITGDLRSRVRGDRALRRQLARLDAPLGAWAVLGNHDYAEGRDPFADGRALDDLDGTPVRLLEDEIVTVERHGRRISLAGHDPRSYFFDESFELARLRDDDADYRILLCHFPGVLDRVAPRSFQLVLSGHLHGGQICVPLPGGKLRLSHGRSGYTEGLYGREGTIMHVSRGVGTTFVPFRFAARPEVTTLVLRSV